MVSGVHIEFLPKEIQSWNIYLLFNLSIFYYLLLLFYLKTVFLMFIYKNQLCIPVIHTINH